MGPGVVSLCAKNVYICKLKKTFHFKEPKPLWHSGPTCLVKWSHHFSVVDSRSCCLCMILCNEKRNKAENKVEWSLRNCDCVSKSSSCLHIFHYFL